jgi:hypothetical protein
MDIVLPPPPAGGPPTPSVSMLANALAEIETERAKENRTADNLFI